MLLSEGQSFCLYSFREKYSAAPPVHHPLPGEGNTDIHNIMILLSETKK